LFENSQEGTSLLFENSQEGTSLLTERPPADSQDVGFVVK